MTDNFPCIKRVCQPRLLATLAIVAALLAGCASPNKSPSTVAPVKYKKLNHQTVEREFRAAWIASVANINWPSKPGLSTSAQKEEIIALLNLVEKNNLNAVILQVRPQADAFYPSYLEPWSYFLTGEQGKAPQPYYDPLAFWIEQAHIRGIKLHAWINPYRAHHVTGGLVTEKSIVKTKPNLTVGLESGYYWLDPTNPKTQQHTHKVVMDIVKRYDIDGIHMDDYFYPYPSYNNNKDFPDSVAYLAYRKGGGQLSQANWRRKAVNDFVKKLYFSIKKEKQHVKFGISPFGIYRPEQPKGIRGFDQYEKLFADAKYWLNEGWIDYFAPQLYWPINQLAQSYPVLLAWWQQQNLQQRHLWPGMDIAKVSQDAGIDEALNQVMINRALLPSAGMVFWNIGHLQHQGEFHRALTQSVFADKALIPASPWLDSVAPEPPQVTFKANNQKIAVRWQHQQSDDVFQWLLYYRYKNEWRYKVLTKHQRSFNLPAFISNSARGTQVDLLKDVAVIAVDRNGNESKRINTSIVPSIIKQALM
ncbi:glycoside hydrolase family 10 protein [Thalassotalea aquiviva]|uniref:glycoside hydrolase family 10 protein n=1 Tax=Thalassotalea aquiviva TaxID=3242415 RepID=UPI00352A900A